MLTVCLCALLSLVTALHIIAILIRSRRRYRSKMSPGCDRAGVREMRCIQGLLKQEREILTLGYER
jgi:hypothetical protein